MSSYSEIALSNQRHFWTFSRELSQLPATWIIVCWNTEVQIKMEAMNVWTKMCLWSCLELNCDLWFNSGWVRHTQIHRCAHACTHTDTPLKATGREGLIIEKGREYLTSNNGAQRKHTFNEYYWIVFNTNSGPWGPVGPQVWNIFMSNLRLTMTKQPEL